MPTIRRWREFVEAGHHEKRWTEGKLRAEARTTAEKKAPKGGEGAKVNGATRWMTSIMSPMNSA